MIVYNGDGGLFYAVGEVRYRTWIEPTTISLSDIDGFLEETDFYKDGFRKMEDFRKEMGLDVVAKNKYAHVYLINKDQLKLALEDATIVEMVCASRVHREEALEDENPNTHIHSESEASSDLHDSDNEPSGDDEDVVNFEVEVEREPFHIDTQVGVDVESECGDSEELNSIYSSDEEGNIEHCRFPQFNAEKDMEDPHFEKGQEFADCATFKNAVKNSGEVTESGFK
ncbi:hypothetical protein LINPERPRIM_LOCUS6866 [Linum perenne]